MFLRPAKFIIVGDISNPFYGRLVKSLERRLSERRNPVFVASSNNDIATEIQMIRFCRSRKVDGIILGHCKTDSVAHVVIEVQDVSTVLFDRDGAERLSAVKVDHYRRTAAALEHLIGLGHKRIALMTPGSQIQPLRDRVRAYQDCPAAAGLTFDPSLLYLADSSMNFAADDAARMLAYRARPTAFLCLGTRSSPGYSVPSEWPNWPFHRRSPSSPSATPTSPSCTARRSLRWAGLAGVHSGRCRSSRSADARRRR